MSRLGSQPPRNCWEGYISGTYRAGGMAGSTKAVGCCCFWACSRWAARCWRWPEVVEGAAGTSFKLGPGGGTGLIVSCRGELVGDCDLRAGPSLVSAVDAGVAVVAVPVGFDGEGVVAPDGSAGAGARGRSEAADEVFGRVVDEPADSVGAGPVEGVFELGHGHGNLRTAPGDVSEVLVPGPLLVSPWRSRWRSTCPWCGSSFRLQVTIETSTTRLIR